MSDSDYIALENPQNVAWNWKPSDYAQAQKHTHTNSSSSSSSNSHELHTRTRLSQPSGVTITAATTTTDAINNDTTKITLDGIPMMLSDFPILNFFLHMTGVIPPECGTRHCCDGRMHFRSVVLYVFSAVCVFQVVSSFVLLSEVATVLLDSDVPESTVYVLLVLYIIGNLVTGLSGTFFVLCLYTCLPVCL
jgi:hypothetical protein